MKKFYFNRKSKGSKKLKLRVPAITDPTQIKTLTDLRRYFNIKKNGWDAILVTDGSGTTIEHAIGWGGVLIRNDKLERLEEHGGVSRGTNNMAELMAVFWPLLCLSEEGLGVKEHGYHVHVISDSQYVVKGIANLMDDKTGTLWASKAASNRPLWLGLLGVRRKGFIIHAHYIPRDTIDLNRLCHDLANRDRKLIKGSLAENWKWDVDNATPDT